MTTKTLPAISRGADGLSRYLAEVRKFPMLEPDQEYMHLSEPEKLARTACF